MENRIVGSSTTTKISTSDSAVLSPHLKQKNTLTVIQLYHNQSAKIICLLDNLDIIHITDTTYITDKLQRKAVNHQSIYHTPEITSR